MECLNSSRSIHNPVHLHGSNLKCSVANTSGCCRTDSLPGASGIRLPYFPHPVPNFQCNNVEFARPATYITGLLIGGIPTDAGYLVVRFNAARNLVMDDKTDVTLVNSHPKRVGESDRHRRKEDISNGLASPPCY